MSAPTSGNPNLTRETKDFIQKLSAEGSPPLYELSYEEARNVLKTAQSGNTSRPDVDVKDLTLPTGPTGEVDIRILRPKSKDRNPLPVVFYFHGGGWVMGDKETHDRLVRLLCAGTKACVVYVNYTPSPEAQYPVPLEQAYAAVEHIVINADEFNIDPKRVAYAGDSAGGNMAIAVSIMARERSCPEAVYQVLFYPVTDGSMSSESYSAFADGPWLTRKAMDWFWDAYLPDKDRRCDLTASPINADASKLRGLPPALIITAENDVLRDEGEAYARRLEEAGVDVCSVRFNGTMHDFVMLDALACTAPAKGAIALAIAELRQAFDDCESDRS